MEVGHAKHQEEVAERSTAQRGAPALPLTGLPRLASTVGNAAFATLARDGAGILPSGTVHPDVEAAIVRTRGGGGALDAGVRDRLAPGLGDSLADVRVHTDDHADALSRSVCARAFTTGADVYFARGEYRPGTSDGDSLLAHELTHVVQQRGVSTTGPLTVSEPGDAFEVEADSVASELTGG
ncbi:MAG: eCIS core domain-containing protein [Solirubrobacteraceae bacterium]